MNNCKLLIYLLLLLLFHSCKKTEIEKSLGDMVAGEYKGTSIILGGTEIPLPLESGTNYLNLDFTVTKSTELSANLQLIFTEKSNGVLSTETEDHPNLKLIRKENSSIGLMENGEELAVVYGQNIEMTVVLEELTTTFKGLKN